MIGSRIALGFVLAGALSAGDAICATPVSIQNSINSATAPVDSAGLHVVLSSGSATNQNVNVSQIAGSSTATAGVNGLLGIGGSSANAATDDASYPVKIGGVYNLTPPTYANGQRTTLQFTNVGGLLIDDVTHPYAHITTATTTTIKSGGGSLHQVVINSKAGSAATAAIYDNTVGSGTLIATLDVSQNSAVTINYDVAFAVGLTIVTSAACDLTVTYR